MQESVDNQVGPVRLAAIAALMCLASCAGRSRWPNFSTQQYPGPMTQEVVPLPPGAAESYPPGPEEVVVTRLADPVQLLPAGQSAAFPLRFFDKRRRANAGAWVFCAPGGKAEVLWPDGTSLVMTDRCTGIIGSPSRGEPDFILRDIERVVFNLKTGDQVELLGGALLSAQSGPWVVDRRLFEILRVRNQSKVPGEVSYRDKVFLIEPGQTIDLPLLSAGGHPIPETPGAEEVAGPGFEVSVYGDVQVAEVADGVRLTANGEHEISGLGVRLHLAEGETAVLGGLGRSGPDEAKNAPEDSDPPEGPPPESGGGIP